jgi:hypothetical protein
VTTEGAAGGERVVSLSRRCDGVEKPLKKLTPGQAAPGLEPGTSQM